MTDSVPFYSGFTVFPNQRVAIRAAADSYWTMTSASILPDVNTNLEQGHVILYAEEIETEKPKFPIAVASLRINSCETAEVNYCLNCFTKVAFFTQGDNIAVTVNGYSESEEMPSIETLKE